MESLVDMLMKQGGFDPTQTGLYDFKCDMDWVPIPIVVMSRAAISFLRQCPGVYCEKFDQGKLLRSMKALRRPGPMIDAMRTAFGSHAIYQGAHEEFELGEDACVCMVHVPTIEYLIKCDDARLWRITPSLFSRTTPPSIQHLHSDFKDFLKICALKILPVEPEDAQSLPEIYPFQQAFSTFALKLEKESGQPTPLNCLSDFPDALFCRLPYPDRPLPSTSIAFDYLSTRLTSKESYLKPLVRLPRGGILADEMGLGKTRTMMHHVYQDFMRESQRVESKIECHITVVVTPRLLVDQWEKEANMYTKDPLDVVIVSCKRTYEKFVVEHKFLDSSVPGEFHLISSIKSKAKRKQRHLEYNSKRRRVSSSDKAEKMHCEDSEAEGVQEEEEEKKSSDKTSPTLRVMIITSELLGRINQDHALEPTGSASRPEWLKSEHRIYKYPIRRMVVDEGHEVLVATGPGGKHRTLAFSATAQELRKVPSDARWIISGTPFCDEEERAELMFMFLGASINHAKHPRFLQRGFFSYKDRVRQSEAICESKQNLRHTLYGRMTVYKAYTESMCVRRTWGQLIQRKQVTAPSIELHIQLIDVTPEELAIIASLERYSDISRALAHPSLVAGLVAGRNNSHKQNVRRHYDVAALHKAMIEDVRTEARAAQNIIRDQNAVLEKHAIPSRVIAHARAAITRAESDMMAALSRLDFLASSKKLLREQFECVICLEETGAQEARTVLLCGHQFCSGCIDDLFRHDPRRRCPTCRQPSRYQNVLVIAPAAPEAPELATLAKNYGSKMAAVLYDLKSAPVGCKIVFYSSFGPIQRILRENIASLGIPVDYFDLSGNTSSQRKTLREYYSSPRTSVLGMNLMNQASGMDQVSIDRLYIFEPFSGAASEGAGIASLNQALWRQLRLSRKAPVHCKFYLARGKELERFQPYLQGCPLLKGELGLEVKTIDPAAVVVSASSSSSSSSSS